MLTMRGKALESGAEGDLVNVLNMSVEAHRAGHRLRSRPRHHGDVAPRDTRHFEPTRTHGPPSRNE